MLVMSMMAAMAAGCGSSSDSTASSSTSGNSTASTETGSTDKKEASGDGQVYYLNFKPEQDEQWQDLAKAYTDETGVPVTVITAADGTYEQTLKSEMAKIRSTYLIPGKRTGWTCKLERLLLRLIRTVNYITDCKER